MDVNHRICTRVLTGHAVLVSDVPYEEESGSGVKYWLGKHGERLNQDPRVRRGSLTPEVEACSLAAVWLTSPGGVCTVDRTKLY